MKKLNLLIIAFLISMSCSAQKADSTTVEVQYDFLDKSAAITFADILYAFDRDYPNINCETQASWLSQIATQAEGRTIEYDCFWFYLFRNGKKEPLLATQLRYIKFLIKYRSTVAPPTYRIKKVKRKKG